MKESCCHPFFLKPGTPGRDFDDILEGKRFGATKEELRSSICWVMVIPELAENGSIELVDWLEARSDSLPPDSSDLIVSVALQEGGAWERENENFWSATREKWNRMLRAKNPVYRLEALFVLNRFEKERFRKLAACANALREKNTVFQFWALQELEKLPGPDSVALIEEFLKDVSNPNDGSMYFADDGDDIRKEAKETLAKCKAE